MAASLKIQALVSAATLALGLAATAPASAAQASAGEAQAQGGPARDDGVRLSGGVRLPAAYDPIEISAPELIAAPASGARETRSAEPAMTGASGEADAAAAFQPPVDTGSATALPWYQRFTGEPSEPQILWSDAESFQVEAGDRWGVTLGYTQGERSPQNFDLQDFRAGAFFELTERVRLGGQLRFTSPEEEIFGEETEDRTPEVRFESAFKF